MNLPLVTIVVLTRNSMPNLDKCLGTMLAQPYPNYKILVVDSASTDATVEYIRLHFPAVHVLPLKENLGYRKGNQVGMFAATGEYIVVCNDDVEVEQNWLSEMVKAMEGDKSLGLVTPKILLYDERSTINVVGNVLHFSGLYGSRGIGESRTKYCMPEELGTVSGCCFMIRRKAFVELQGFSEDFNQLDISWHASFEDADLSWRAHLLGWKIGYVPDSIMYHKYRRKPTTAEMFCSYEWGRLLMILRNYSIKSLILISPVLLLLEILSWGYAILKGRVWIRAKWKALLWMPSHASDISVMRARIQSSRKVPDHVIVNRMEPSIRLAHFLPWPSIGRAVEKVLDSIFFIFYHLLLFGLKFSQ